MCEQYCMHIGVHVLQYTYIVHVVYICRWYDTYVQLRN